LEDNQEKDKGNKDDEQHGWIEGARNARKIKETRL